MKIFIALLIIALAAQAGASLLSRYPGGRSADEKLAGQFLSGILQIIAWGFYVVIAIGLLVRLFQAF